jgi:protein-S-isoprenylcysteine O-methyltransferase Ste14
MTPELFKAAFIALFCGLTLIRLYFRVTTGHLTGGFYPGSDSPWLFAFRVVFSVPLVISIVLYLWFPERAQWTKVPLPVGLRASGVVGGGGALALLAWSHVSLGQNFSPLVDLRPDHELIRQGAYRWMRHPMYSAYALLFMCAFLISENWGVAVSGLGIIVPLMTIRLQREEILLRERFGTAYTAYANQTARFLPLSWLKPRE